MKIEGRSPDVTETVEAPQTEIAERKQIEKDLEKSEERFRSLVEQLKDYAIYSTDTQGTITSWNLGGERIFGYLMDEMVGKHSSIFYTREDIETRKPWRILEVASAEGQFKEEGWRVRKDGSRYWADVVMTALRDESGKLNGFLNMTRDITDNVEAREGLNYRLAMEDLVIKISNRFIKISTEEMDDEINRTLEQIREFVGADRSYFCLLSSDEKTVARVYESCSAGTRPRAEHLRGLALDSLPWLYGKFIRAESVSVFDIAQLPPEAIAERGLWGPQSVRAMAAMPMFLGKSLMGYFALNIEREAKGWKDDDIRLLNVVGEVLVNALERRRTEEERVKMEAAILEIRRREMEARLQESEKWAVVGKMAAGIAHDIRNPINYVSLALDHLARSRGNESREDPKHLRLFEGARSELIRVNRMIQDLLDYGRTQTPGLEVKNGSEILVKSCEEIFRRHVRKEIRILPEGADKELLIRVEPNLLARALENLLENAVDAAGPRGEVRAGIGYDPRSDHEIVLWVQDSGPGIPEENLGKIFVPYFTTKKSGAGLGLPLVQKWVTEMGGKIRVNNTPGGGARFELIFPVANSETTAKG